MCVCVSSSHLCISPLMHWDGKARAGIYPSISILHLQVYLINYVRITVHVWLAWGHRLIKLLIPLIMTFLGCTATSCVCALMTSKWARWRLKSAASRLLTVNSSVYSGADERKHQSSASLAFVRGIHRSPVNSPHKRPVTRKMFLFDDVTVLPAVWISI